MFIVRATVGFALRQEGNVYSEAKVERALRQEGNVFRRIECL